MPKHRIKDSGRTVARVMAFLGRKLRRDPICVCHTASCVECQQRAFYIQVGSQT